MMRKTQSPQLEAGAPELQARPDREYQARIDAARVTALWKTSSARKLDSGRRPFDECDLFGGSKQEDLF